MGSKINCNQKKKCLGITSAQGWLLHGFQAPSEIDFGELVLRFLEHFRVKMVFGVQLYLNMTAKVEAKMVKNPS